MPVATENPTGRVLKLRLTLRVRLKARRNPILRLRLDSGHTCDKLYKYAAHAPDVSFKAPAQAQYHFRRPVVAGGHDGAVVLILEGGAAKIYHLDLTCGRLQRS